MIAKICKYGVIVIALIAVLLVLDYSKVLYLSPLQISTQKMNWSVTAGESLRSAVERLEQADVLADSYLIAPKRYAILHAKLHGIERRIQIGDYKIKRGDTLAKLFDKLNKGDIIYQTFTIIEGSVFATVLHQLKQHSQIKWTTHEPETMRQQLGVEQPTLEGWLFPDTYHFRRGASEIEILQQAYQKMQQVLDESWDTRDADTPLQSPYEALILASIIEKETNREAEKPLIAAVFINRLKKNMLLQADPTVIYGLGKRFKGDLTRKHLRQDTPYNTYTRKGLPPSPIALPSASSIHAATHPSDTSALYFVSKGNGSHHFSNTHEEHRKLVAKYQLKK